MPRCFYWNEKKQVVFENVDAMYTLEQFNTYPYGSTFTFSWNHVDLLI